MYVLNVKEDEVHGNDFTIKVAAKCSVLEVEFVIVSSKIEAEISTLETIAEKKEFLGELGLKESGLSKIIAIGYKILNLISFFTAFH
jgi:ribosome-binding ATPase YchF (GTP1/OBG family)